MLDVNTFVVCWTTKQPTSFKGPLQPSQIQKSQPIKTKTSKFRNNLKYQYLPPVFSTFHALKHAFWGLIQKTNKQTIQTPQLSLQKWSRFPGKSDDRFVDLCICLFVCLFVSKISYGVMSCPVLSSFPGSVCFFSMFMFTMCFCCCYSSCPFYSPVYSVCTLVYHWLVLHPKPVCALLHFPGIK